MDGFSTCAQLCALPSEEAMPPLLLMSAIEDEEKRKQAYSAGANDFLVKPINWNALYRRLVHMAQSYATLQKLEAHKLRLLKAKQLAKLGDWEWQVATKSLCWSDEIYNLLDLDRQTFNPESNNFWNYIDIADMPYFKKSIRQTIKTKNANDIEFGIITAKGQVRFVLQNIEAVRGGDGQLKYLIGTIQDITERKAQENKIMELAFYDEVTQLPNRLYFLKNLSSTIALSRRHGWKFALLFLDLDGFKGVNDTYGHLAGDQLLKEISRRLVEGLRRSDVTTRLCTENDGQKINIARLGGDEFIILLNVLETSESAAIVAERIHNWINEPVKLKDHIVHIGASIGIAVFPDDGEELETLLKNADIAMYNAKKMGKGHFQFFNEEMASRTKKRLEMETYMFLAASQNELLLYYQPVHDTESGELIGAEALMRWSSPELGFLPSVDFISLAEENGMINQFGEWALRAACRQHKLWQEQGLGKIAIAINLCSLQINQPMFLAMVKNTIQEFDVDPFYLTFEITETVIMTNTPNMLTKLKELKGLGIKLAIDDFGTGYSSLRYLKHFPLDVLKIDYSFIKDLPDDPDASAIVNAILALAKAYKLIAIAEGVETEKQLSFLQETPCYAVQGFYFAKPLPAADFQAYWERKNSTRYERQPVG